MSHRTQFQETRAGKVVRAAAVEDVIMLVAEDKYVVCHHTNGSLVMDATLDRLETEFNGMFVRAHRSRLVARRRIQSVRRDMNGVHLMRVDGLDNEVVASRRGIRLVKKTLAERGGE